MSASFAQFGKVFGDVMRFVQATGTLFEFAFPPDMPDGFFPVTGFIDELMAGCALVGPDAIRLYYQ